MKIGEVFKLSLHNMKNNKLRTFLTIVVIFIMATIVMVISSFGLSFYMSVDKTIQQQFNDEGAKVSIRYNMPYDSNSRVDAYLEMDYINRFVEAFESEDNVLTTLSFSSSYAQTVQGKNCIVQPIYLGSNSLAGQYNYLVAGRMWNKSDAGKANVWVSKTLMNTYKIGETISIDTRPIKSFEICGFIDDESGSKYYNSPAIYLDYSNFTDVPVEYGVDVEDRFSRLYISQIEAKLIAQEGIDYGLTTINTLKDLSKEFTTSIKGSEGYDVYISILDDTALVNYLLIGVVAVVLFLCVIIILLSIGSVSNTIKITVEQNRKFFGMMKAIGMENKTVRSVVKLQAIMMILVSVLLASLVVFGLSYAFKPIIGLLLGAVTYGSTPILLSTLPFYVPIITFVCLIGFVLLFTRSSLMKISKMDVISVISEVN